jgi:hypothetical protein
MENQRWKEIPRDILKLILEKYDGRFIERNGRYMVRIPKNDERRALLRKIPRKEFHGLKLHEKRIEMGFTSDNPVSETFVHFREKKMNNQTFSIYFREQLEYPYTITHYFGRRILSMDSFILP